MTGTRRQGDKETRRLAETARLALPLMDARSRTEAERLIAELTANASEPETLEAFTRRAGAAFEEAMQPVRTAIVSALHEGDVAALKGFRALLPALLAEVNADPTLEDLLAYQLGAEVLKAMMNDEGRMMKGERA